MAPVFDSGNSLFHNYPIGSILPTGKNLLKTGIASFAATLAEQMRYANGSSINLFLLPSESEYLEVLQQDKTLQEFDISQRLLLLEHTKGFLIDFLNGAKIWSYGYQKNLK